MHASYVVNNNSPEFRRSFRIINTKNRWPACKKKFLKLNYDRNFEFRFLVCTAVDKMTFLRVYCHGERSSLSIKICFVLDLLLKKNKIVSCIYLFEKHFFFLCASDVHAVSFGYKKIWIQGLRAETIAKIVHFLKHTGPYDSISLGNLERKV